MASIAQRSDELRRPQKLIPRNCAACGKAEVDHLPLIVAGGQSLVHTFRTSHGTWYCDYCLKKGTSQNDGEHLAKKPITDTGGRLIRAMTISVPTTAEGALNAGADQSAAARAEPGAEQSDNLVTDNGPFVGLTELQAQQRVAEGAGPEPEQPGQPGQQFLLGSTVTRFTQVTTESFESLDEAMVAWKKTSNVKAHVLCRVAEEMPVVKKYGTAGAVAHIIKTLADLVEEATELARQEAEERAAANAARLHAEQQQAAVAEAARARADEEARAVAVAKLEAAQEAAAQSQLQLQRAADDEARRSAEAAAVAAEAARAKAAEDAEAEATRARAEQEAAAAAEAIRQEAAEASAAAAAAACAAAEQAARMAEQARAKAELELEEARDEQAERVPEVDCPPLRATQEAASASPEPSTSAGGIAAPASEQQPLGKHSSHDGGHAELLSPAARADGAADSVTPAADALEAAPPAPTGDANRDAEHASPEPDAAGEPAKPVEGRKGGSGRKRQGRCCGPPH